MDIKCPVCGEPWDMDELHERIAEQYPDQPWRLDGKFEQSEYDRFYDEARLAFRTSGCKYFGTQHADTTADPAIGEIMDLMGDDLDGAASLLEDFDL